MIFSQETYNDLLDFYITADTERYHNKRGIPNQTVKSHSFGMLLLLRQLHPGASKNLIWAIVEHDLAETDGYFFDAPHDVKEEFPVIREIEAIKEKQFRDDFGLGETILTEDERLWLKFLDGLDVLCYIEINVPVHNPQSQAIYERQLKVTDEFAQKLKARGYLTDPSDTVQ